MEAAGKITVRLHTGDPCLYGAIREQMDVLDAEGDVYKRQGIPSARSGVSRPDAPE